MHDYVTLVEAFQALASKPKIWIALLPPLFSNQSGKIDPEYFASTIIPDIKQAANLTGVPTIDVYSAVNSPSYFNADGEQINDEGAQLVADTIYKSINVQDT